MKKAFYGLYTRLRIKQWRTGFIILLMVIPTGNVFARGSNNNSSPTTSKNDTLVFENQGQLIKYMLENKNFVLEADYLQNRYGDRRFVNSTINFVKVDSTNVVIQIGSDYRLGANGVGGVTAKGKITNWKLTEDPKNQSYNLYINAMTPIGIYDLQISVDSDGHSTALLTGLTAGQLTFEGDLVPNSLADVYEGSSL